MALVCVLVFVAPYWIGALRLDSIIQWGYVVTIVSAPLLFVVALALSIFYRGTLDPRLVLGRFTLWSVLGVLLTFLFMLLERSLAIKAVQWLELPPETGSLFAGAAIAATFQPIRRRTESAVTDWVSRVMPTVSRLGNTRLEAAVVVTDITGYTALSARDEPSALVATALVQTESRRVCDKHDGKFVKSTGDGAIMFFHTADDALAAITLLHASIGSSSLTLNIPVQLHSGVHWGEFIEAHDGDIFGQTVNLAARIADRAKAGEIWTSEAFSARLTTNQNNLLAMGPQDFKNVPGGVPCMRVVPA